MSEVGVLNLTIKDNSEQAGQGLNSLAGALRAVKEAKSRLDLSAVAKQVTQLAQTIQNVKGTSTIIKNLGTMFNAINKFANLKDFNIDTEKLRDTAQNMLKLADAKEKVDAASKSGAGVSDWRMGMNEIARSAKETVETVTEQTGKLEKTLTHFQQMTGKVTDIQLFGGKKQVPGQIAMDLDGTAQRIQEIVSQINIADAVISKTTSEAENAGSRIVSAVSSSAVTGPVTQIADSFRNAATNVRYYSSALDTALPKVQALGSAEMIEAGNARYAAMSERERVLAMAEATGKIPPIDTSRTQEMTANFVQTASEVQNLNISLTETGDIVTSTLIPRFTEMYQIWSMMAYEFGMFANSAKQLMSGESFLALGDGRTPGQLLLGDGSDPQTFLSTWVQTGEQWKQNWVDWASEAAQEMRASWSPDWIIGEGTVTAATEELEDVTKVTDDIRQTASATSALSEEVENLGETAAGQAQAFNEAIEFARQWNASQPGQNQAIENAQADIAWIDNLVNSASQIDLLNMKIEDMTAKLYEGATSGNMTGEQIAKLIEQIHRAQEEVEHLTASSTGLIGAWNAMTGALGRLFPTLTGVLKRFKSMVTMRALRYVIRSIASGFSEGVQNLYQYSKAVGTSFAPAMDSAATVLQQFKNSIGAAVAPLISSLIPAFQTVVNWLIQGINYLNQFFALLTGQSTWTRALPEQAEAFEKSSKLAKDSSKTVKDLLADWDELNIIQSNSSGGTNNTTKKTATEYSNMFEEVSEFESKIKDIVDFIEKHLGGLPNLLTKIGAIILGWKFSKAFSGILGQIGKLVAGGALLTIGVELAYGGGFEAGKKGYFDTGDLIASIGGTLAAAIGGSLITSGLGLGSGLGFAIGLGAGIFMTLYGYINGQRDAADAVKWGNLHLTAEEIQEYVKKQFSFDIVSETKVLHSNVEFTQDALNEANAKITEFETKLKEATVNVGLGVDADPEGTTVKDALQSAQEACKAVDKLIDDTNTSIQVGMTILPERDENGEDISDDVLAGIKVAEQPIRDFMYKMGEALSEAMYAGEAAGWENGTDAAALKLMQEQQEVYAKAKQYANEMELESNLKQSTKDVIKDGIFDRDTALAALALQEQQMEDFKNKAISQAEAQAQNLRYLAGIAQAAAELEFSKGHIESGSDLERSAQNLREQAEDKVDKAIKSVDEKLKESRGTIAKDWAELIKSVYGNDIDLSVMESTFPQRDDIWQSMFEWLTGPTDSYFKQGLKNASDKGNFIKSWLEGEFSSFDINSIIPELTSEAGLNIWDLLSEGARKNLFTNTADSLGSASQARQAIMSAFGLSYDDIRPYVDNYAEYAALDAANAVEKAAKDTNLFGGFFGLSYQAPIEEIPTATLPIELVPEDTTLDYTVGIDDDAKIFINPDIELSKDAQTAIEMVRNAINSGLGMDEVKAASNQVIEMFGNDTFLEAMPYIQQLMDAYRKLQEGNYEDFGNLGSQKPWRVSGAAGMSDTSYNNGAVIQSGGVVKTEPVDNTQDVNNMEQGVRKGSSEMLSALQSILRVAEAIQRKEFKVVLTPNSSWARHNGASQSAMNYVTGDA